MRLILKRNYIETITRQQNQIPIKNKTHRVLAELVEFMLKFMLRKKYIYSGETVSKGYQYSVNAERVLLCVQ